MSTDVSGLGVSRLLLVGALALAPVMQAGAASAVTLAFYESGWSMNFRVTGARDMDGEPVGTDAIRTSSEGITTRNCMSWMRMGTIYIPPTE
jgi:hypothetical protein